MNFYIRYLKQQVSPTISDYHFFQHIFLQETQRSCFLQWLVPNRFPRSSLTTQACLLITLWLQLKITHKVLEMRELTMGASRITMLLQQFIPYPVAPCHCFACIINITNPNHGMSKPLRNITSKQHDTKHTSSFTNHKACFTLLTSLHQACINNSAVNIQS